MKLYVIIIDLTKFMFITKNVMYLMVNGIDTDKIYVHQAKFRIYM